MSLVPIPRYYDKSWILDRPAPLGISNTGTVSGGVNPGTGQYLPNRCGGGSWIVADECGSTARAIIPDTQSTRSITITLDDLFSANGAVGDFTWSTSVGKLRCLNGEDASSKKNCNPVGLDLTGIDPCSSDDIVISFQDECGGSASYTKKMGANGDVFVTPEGNRFVAYGGTAPYTYAISDGTIDPDTGVADLTGACGWIEVTATDDCGATGVYGFGLNGSWQMITNYGCSNVCNDYGMPIGVSIQSGKIRRDYFIYWGVSNDPSVPCSSPETISFGSPAITTGQWYGPAWYGGCGSGVAGAYVCYTATLCTVWEYKC